MSALIEVPQLDSWFLVDWPETGPPGVLMEFGTRAEAEAARMAALTDATRERGLPVRLLVRSALAMLEDAELRGALTDWDLEFADP